MRSRSRRISLVCAPSPLDPRGALLTLASSQWLTVLPQVVSRILHTNAEVLDVLEIILKRVLASYPHLGDGIGSQVHDCSQIEAKHACVRQGKGPYPVSKSLPRYRC